MTTCAYTEPRHARSTTAEQPTGQLNGPPRDKARGSPRDNRGMTARAWTLPILVRETTRMTRRGPHAASGLEEGPSHRQELPGRARHPLAREPPQKIQTSEVKIFEAKPGRRAGVGNVGKAASQHPRRPRIAAPVQAQELAAARRRLASFKPVCQRGMSEISPPARRSCSRGRTCRHPNRTLARAEKGARQNLPQHFPQNFNTQI